MCIRDRDLVAAVGESPGAHEVTAVDRDEIDIRDPDACLAMVAGHDFVVNVAAWTAVDEAETQEPAAFAVNAVGAANLARACSASRVPMVQVSTDTCTIGTLAAEQARARFAAPTALTAKAAASWVSASSTAVHAATLTTKSWPATAPRQASGSVMSSSSRPTAV